MGIEYAQLRSNRIIFSSRFIENWFPFRYSFDVYSGCEYDCPFCRVNWQENKKVIVKDNLLPLLKAELSDLESALAEQKLPNKVCIGVGGGFNEVFSPINEKKKDSDEALRELVRRGHLPVVMTQNPQYLLERMRNVKDVMVVVSFASPDFVIKSSSKTNDDQVISLEPKLRAMKQLVAEGMLVGATVMPIIPHVHDADDGSVGEQENNMELLKLFQSIKKAGASFILFDTIDQGGLEQLYVKGFFKDYPSKEKTMIEKYFRGNDSKVEWQRYQRNKRMEVNSFLVELGVLPFIPLPLVRKFLSPKDCASVALGQMYYMEKMGHDYLALKNKEATVKEAYKFASYSLNRLSEKDYKILLKNDSWKNLSGVGNYLSLVIGQMAYHNFSTYDEKIEKLWALATDH